MASSTCALQLGKIKNDRDEFFRPPDLSHAEYTVDGRTRVWKNEHEIPLSDLGVGDELLINLAGSTKRCAPYHGNLRGGGNS